MAALPYMPLFVADYLADTAHLTPAQHGAYLLLIMNYWQRGKPLPNDDARLAQIAKMSRRDWAHNRGAILEFFTEQENLLIHSRITHELSRVEAKSLKCKDAAQASVQRRRNGRSASAEPTDTDKETEKERKKEEGGADAPAGYAFFGRTIRLKPNDLQRWKDTFHAIPDVMAELTSLDAWLEEQPESKRKGWFHFTAGALNRKHQEMLALRLGEDSGPRIGALG